MNHLLFQQLASYHKEHIKQPQDPERPRKIKAGWYLQAFRTPSIWQKRLKST